MNLNLELDVVFLGFSHEVLSFTIRTTQIIFDILIFLFVPL
jgi:hypothetical protein